MLKKLQVLNEQLQSSVVHISLIWLDQIRLD